MCPVTGPRDPRWQSSAEFQRNVTAPRRLGSEAWCTDFRGDLSGGLLTRSDSGGCRRSPERGSRREQEGTTSWGIRGTSPSLTEPQCPGLEEATGHRPQPHPHLRTPETPDIWECITAGCRPAWHSALGNTQPPLPPWTRDAAVEASGGQAD